MFDAQQPRDTVAHGRRSPGECPAALGKIALRCNTLRGRGDAVVVLDRRSRLSRDVMRFRRGLMEHVGNRPSPVERALINICEQMYLRMIVFDVEFAEAGTMSGYDAKMYLGWANSLARTLNRLGLKGRDAPRMNLADYLAGREGPRKDKPAGQPKRRAARAMPPPAPEPAEIPLRLRPTRAGRPSRHAGQEE